MNSPTREELAATLNAWADSTESGICLLDRLDQAAALRQAADFMLRALEGRNAELEREVVEAAKGWLSRYEEEVRDPSEEAPCKRLVAALDALSVPSAAPASAQPCDFRGRSVSNNTNEAQPTGEGFYEKLWRDFVSLQSGDATKVCEHAEAWYRAGQPPAQPTSAVPEGYWLVPSAELKVLINAARDLCEHGQGDHDRRSKLRAAGKAFERAMIAPLAASPAPEIKWQAMTRPPSRWWT